MTLLLIRFCWHRQKKNRRLAFLDNVFNKLDGLNSVFFCFRSILISYIFRSILIDDELNDNTQILCSTILSLGFHILNLMKLLAYAKFVKGHGISYLLTGWHILSLHVDWLHD